MARESGMNTTIDNSPKSRGVLRRGSLLMTILTTIVTHETKPSTFTHKQQSAKSEIPKKKHKSTVLARECVCVCVEMLKTAIRYTIDTTLCREWSKAKSASRNLYFQRHQSHCNHHYRRHNHQANNPPVESRAK